jgi:hypothetical protein
MQHAELCFNGLYKSVMWFIAYKFSDLNFFIFECSFYKADNKIAFSITDSVKIS